MPHAPDQIREARILWPLMQVMQRYICLDPAYTLPATTEPTDAELDAMLDVVETLKQQWKDSQAAVKPDA